MDDLSVSSGDAPMPDPHPDLEREARSKLEGIAGDISLGVRWTPEAAEQHVNTLLAAAARLATAEQRIEELRAERSDLIAALGVEQDQIRRLHTGLLTLIRRMNDLDVALAECDAKAKRVSDHPDGEEWVGSYYLRCGPWHRVLGKRGNVADALTKAQAALDKSAERER